MSYLSAQYGFGCDNVVSFEAVLANASVVNVNATSYPDLFVALKGGGNQFAMVTRFTLRTMPIGQVWGGVRFYDANQIPTIVNATHDFTSNLLDPKGAIIVNAEYILGKDLDQVSVFFFYDGAAPPPKVFTKFDAVMPEISSCRTRSYSNLVSTHMNIENNGRILF